MTSAWLIWWSVLCAATAVNIAAWCYAAALHGLRANQVPGEVLAVRRQLLLLSAIYVLGCGFRSVLPMVDVPRICLQDTWLSRIVVGRSVATVAELAFVTQWALLLREAGAAAGGGLVARVSLVLVPLIVVAELFSWDAVLRTSNLSHAIENSLWTLAAVLAVAGLVSARRRLDEQSRRFVAAAVVCGGVYVAFMAIVDVPMYLSRWNADLATGHVYLSWSDGMREILQRCAVTREWTAWRDDVPWLTLYFTVAVWISIALAHVPPLRPASREMRPVMQQS